MASLQFTVWDSASEVANGPVLNEGAVTLDATARNTPVMYSSYAGGRGVRVRIICVGDDGAVAWGPSSGLSVANDGTDGRIMADGSPEYFDIQAGSVIRCIALGAV